MQVKFSENGLWRTMNCPCCLAGRGVEGGFPGLRKQTSCQRVVDIFHGRELDTLSDYIISDKPREPRDEPEPIVLEYLQPTHIGGRQERPSRCHGSDCCSREQQI